MPDTAVRIASISDLHLGWKCWPPRSSTALMDHLLGHIEAQRPQIVICTGDLLDSPVNPRAWCLARQLVTGLQDICGTRGIARWVPGNHDLAIAGIFGIKSIALAALRRCFGRYIFQDCLLECPELGLTLLGVDSVPPFWQSRTRWFSRRRLHPYGEVPAEALNRWAAARAKFPRGSRSISSDSLMIAVMHHFPLHTLPPESGTTKLTADEAGPLLVTLAKNGTGLLLHGDVHRPAFRRLTICFDGKEHEIVSLCAGRIKAHKPWKNSYVVITVRSADEISAEVYGMPNGRTFEPVAHYDIRSAAPLEWRPGAAARAIS